MIGIPKSISFLSDLIQLFCKFLNSPFLILDNFSKGHHVFFLSLSGILGGLSVSFELFFLWKSSVEILLAIGRVFVVGFDILSWFHKLGHFIPVEDLLLVFWAALALSVPQVFLLDVLLLLNVHLSLDLVVIFGLMFGFDEVIKELCWGGVAIGEVSDKLIVLWR